MEPEFTTLSYFHLFSGAITDKGDVVMKFQVANCGKTVRCHQMAGGEPFIPETLKSQKSKVSDKGMAFPSKPNVLLCTIYFLTLLLHISSIHADATLGPPQHVPWAF